MDTPQIDEVLQSLNHSTRRVILLILAKTDKETAFTELMDNLDLKNSSSGQFSYHLKMLSSSNLIQKTFDNKYAITDLGKTAYALMSMVNTEEDVTIGNKIINSYKNLTPFDQVILGFFGIVLGLFIVSSQVLFEFTIINNIYFCLYFFLYYLSFY